MPSPLLPATPARQPIVGITGRAMAGWKIPNIVQVLQSATIEYSDNNVARHLVAAGAMPVYLSRQSDPTQVAKAIDALVLSGGEDVDPHRYGSQASTETGMVDPDRDEFELALFTAAVDADIPVLGICRGAQLINVALGGTLIQHLDPDAGDHHSFMWYRGEYRSQGIDIDEDSILSSIFGAHAHVNSFHHQSVDTPGEGVRVTARAVDGVIEGYEVPGRRISAVQWHPEFFSAPDPIFTWFVDSVNTN